MNIEDRVDKLKKETVALRKEMIIMKTLVKQQNELIKVLLENSQADEAGIQHRTKCKDWFPIRTQDELDKFEKTVNHKNRKEIIYEVQLCIRSEGLSHALHKILHEELIVNYNLEGIYNKGRLLDYENLMDVLFKATQMNGWDHERFISELRNGLRKIKKRTLKLNRKRSLAEWSEFQKNNSKSDGTEDDNSDNDEDDEATIQYNQKTKDWFPIRTQDELDKFEKAVSHTNRKDIIYEAQTLIQPEGLSHNLHKVMDENLVVNYNLEGKYNRGRLLNYENLMDVLFKATQVDGLDHEKFIAELRHGMRKIKKRILKRNKRRSLMDWSEFQNDNSKSDDTEDDDDGDNYESNEAAMQYSKKTIYWFPIRTQDELDKFEKLVNPTNREKIIYEVKIRIQPEGLSHNLHKIVDENLVDSYNLEGNYNRGRLLNYENLMDVLFKATRVDGWDHEKFIAELRHGMRKIKRRILKRNKKRSLTDWSEFQNENSKSDDTEDDVDGDNDESNEATIQYNKKTKDWFPIRTQDELDKFEKSVNLSNREKIIYEAQLLIRQGGMCQTVNKIFAENLIVNYNLEGKYNKRRLLDYDNLIDVLFKATQADGWNHETFIAEFRKGIRKIKKRKYKLKSRKRCKLRCSGKSDSEDEDDDEFE